MTETRETKEKQICNQCGYLFCEHRQPQEMSEIARMIQDVKMGRISAENADAFLLQQKALLKELENAIVQSRKREQHIGWVMKTLKPFSKTVST